MPTDKMKAVGASGAAAMIAMGIAEQVWPVIDWSHSVMGVPIGALVVFVASTAAGWLKTERNPTNA